MSSNPTHFTAALEGGTDLPTNSDGYRLIELVEKYWVLKGKPLHLDEWQKHLLIRILETYPPDHRLAGNLRYRSCVVSMPRKNGKSLLAAVLALYGLLQHHREPTVIGLARTVDQANIVYNYTGNAVLASAGLSSVLRTTGTRGITRVGGIGNYKVLTAKFESVQGYESTLCICDELHVLDPRIWDGMVESQFAEATGLLVGITTAGDISSVLLKRLYEQGEKAIAGEQERFGFFCWEAPTAELSRDNLIAANPAIACERVDLDEEFEKAAAMPPGHVQQFRLNRFSEGLSEPWVSPEVWAKCAGKGITGFNDVFYAIDITTTHSFASIVAGRKNGDVIETEYVLQMPNPTLEKMQAEIKRLRNLGSCTFVMDTYRWPSLTKWLEDQHYKVERLGGGRRAEACSTTYAAIMRGKVRHANHPLINAQFGQARLKNSGDTQIIVPNGKQDIEAVYATVYAIYAANTIQRSEILLF